MQSKWTIGLSVLAILISFFTFFYNFLVSEFGVLIGSGDYNLQVMDYLEIYNTPGFLTLQPAIILRNDGTRPLRMNKVRALLQLGDEFHVFTSTFIANLRPQSIWSGAIQLEEKLSDEDRQKRNELMMNTISFIIDKYKTTKDKNIPIFLSSQLLNRIEKVYQSNAGWMKKDKHYYLLLLFWMNKDVATPSEKHLFKFSFNSFQKKLLTTYQLATSVMLHSDLIPGNLFVSYHARPKLEEIKVPDQIAGRYQKYKELSTD